MSINRRQCVRVNDLQDGHLNFEGWKINSIFDIVHSIYKKGHIYFQGWKIFYFFMNHEIKISLLFCPYAFQALERERETGLDMEREI